ncbi:acid protease [Suillus decipiens]|nr:acid protease [Suillus decipiens]
MFSVVFLSALLAFSVTGSPVEVRNSPITLPMTRRLAFSNITDLVRHDEARLAAFQKHSTHGRRGANLLPNPAVPLEHANLGDAFSDYTVNVKIGDSPTSYNLIVDSASAITWVGAGLPYLSRTGVDTQQPVEVNYGYGSFKGMTYNNIICSTYLRLVSIGTIFQDELKIGDMVQLTIPGMHFGVASTSNNIAADGVLGIGPRLLGLETLQNFPGQMIPTVTERLDMQHTISHPVVGIFFQPLVANQVNNGEISFGGTNPTKYTNPLTYTDVTTIAPSSRYWGINQRITLGNIEILPATAGVVDSGCTFLYLAIDAYERYRAATGGILNPANGLLQISLPNYPQLNDLKFHIGTRVYRLVRNAQIWPRFLNYSINGGNNDIFLIVKALATPTGSGLDFVNGYPFLQRFYTVLDSGQGRVGFARTRNTGDNTN